MKQSTCESMEIETCVGCGTEDNVWVFGRCTRCWLSRDEAPPECDGCRYGYLNQQGHTGPGGCLYEDLLKTDSFNLSESGAPELYKSSQMYISRSRSPSPPPSSPCEKIYVCVHRNCQTIVEQPGSECGKCNKTPSWTQISDGHFCPFEECPTCDPTKHDTEPGVCTTRQCDDCGDLFFNRPDSDLCDSCKDLTLSRCPDCCCLFEEWSFFGNERCRPCSTAEIENRPRCSLCGSDFEKHEVNFDQFGVCLECRTTPPCTCGYCRRCENTRRLAAPKLCPCGEQSVSDLWLQCVDCYYDERNRRFSE